MGVLASIRILLTGAGKNTRVSVSVEQPTAPAPLPEHHPRIGISGATDASASVIAMVNQIRATGASVVFLGDHAQRLAKFGSAEEAVAHDLAGLDGLVIMGNNGDIDPAKYGQAKHPQTKVETNLARVAYEEAAEQYALESGMPQLDICGGMQRLNVLGDGTLHQHVPDLVGDNHHMQSDQNVGPSIPVQRVQIVGGTRLAEIGAGTDSVYTPTHAGAPPGVIMENSFHHQAVDKVRDDFRVSAVSDDGIIEAIEPKPGSRYANQYVLGIQWHPEFGASDLGPKIANSIAQAARDYAMRKEQANAIPDDTVLTGGMVDKLMRQRQQQSIVIMR